MLSRSTIVTFILALVFVATAVYVARTDTAEAVPGAGEKRPLFDDVALPVRQVDRISLHHRGQTALVFARAQLEWKQNQPFAYPLRRQAMQRMIRQAAGLTVFDEIDPASAGNDVDLKTLSLDPPEATMTFQWDDQKVALELGRRGIAGRAYLKFADKPTVYVVNQDLHRLVLDTDPKEWRDRLIFHQVGINSTRIERRTPQQTMVLVNDNNQWSMMKPIETRIDQEALKEFFSSLGSARLGGFVVDQPEDRAQFGLHDPVASLTIETDRRVSADASDHEAPDTQRLLIGSEMGGTTQDRFAMIEHRPVVFRLPARVLLRLFQNAERFIEPTGSGVPAADVKVVRIDGPDGDFKLERDLERWIAPGYEKKQVSAELVNELLQQITQVRAPNVAIVDAFPHELQKATITLIGFDRTPLDSVRIIREAAENKPRWGMENGDNVLRIYPTSMKLRLRPSEYGLEGVLEQPNDPTAPR